MPESPAGGYGAAQERKAGEGGLSCWILIDIESLFCASCLEPLVDLCRALPSRIQEEKVRAIRVFDAPAGDESASLRAGIVLKKWRAFQKIHGIRFPAVADTGRFFRRFVEGGIVVLAVHDGWSALVSYPLPFKPGQMAEIVEILAGGILSPAMPPAAVESPRRFD